MGVFMHESRGDDVPSLSGRTGGRSTVDEFEKLRQRVPPRVMHRCPHDRIAIERTTRILCACLDDGQERAFGYGSLFWLMLVGDNADPQKIDKHRRELSEFELWAFVDPAFNKGRARHVDEARHIIKAEVDHLATIMLSIFTIDEPKRFRVEGNQYLTDRYEAGIVLYDRAMDGPREPKAQARFDRITAAAMRLPEPLRSAFAWYRRHGQGMVKGLAKCTRSSAKEEMHLAQAFGKLLGCIGEDALPHSLRPGTRNHPSHNLNLYHRPKDFDRMLAVSHYRRALHFLETAKETLLKDRLDVLVHHAAYATEFGLKAILLKAGYDDHSIRWQIGLDLEHALLDAVGNGLREPSPDLMRLIVPLSRYHSQGRTPEQARVVEAAMPPDEVVATVCALIRSVGSVTGYEGLPADTG
jgi:HEPN domain-containing protein